MRNLLTFAKKALDILSDEWKAAGRGDYVGWTPGKGWEGR